MNAEPERGSIAVVHLVLASYGIEPFRDFIDSYRRHPAGLDHRLVLAMKGFASEEAKSGHLQLVRDVYHVAVEVPDEGFDIGSYFHVTDRLKADFYLFLNSRSVFLADLWLAKMKAAVDKEGVGVAGATGSFQSLSSHEKRDLGSRFRSRWVRAAKRRLRYIRGLRWYPPFPNPHVRTNAIMLPRAVLQRLRPPRLRNKEDAFHFESGRSGLSRQILAMGLRIVIVDRDGRCLDPASWPTSNVFWQQDQAQLLIRDNQTERYARAERGQRDLLSSFAWENPGPIR
jgi:hypothetical protein